MQNLAVSALAEKKMELLCGIFQLNGSVVEMRYSKHHENTLYNFDPLKPHFYIVILGFKGVYNIFFLFLLKNIDCGYSLEPPR